MTEKANVNDNIDCNAKSFEIRELLSYVALRVSMYFNDTELAVGTAFIYLYQEKPYLITNWHNVSGRDPSDLKPKHSKCALPNKFFVEVPFVISNSEINSESFSINWEKHPVDIYHDGGDEPMQANWYEHPQYGYKVDVVAIPVHEDKTEIFSPLKSNWYVKPSEQIKCEQIEIPRKTAICSANDPELNLEKIVLMPSLDVFVLGFPRGMSGGANFPVWKRGSIASEPDLDIDDLPKIFIDTATREGMSGAPVFVIQRGYWRKEGKDRFGNFQEVSGIGEGRRFIGVYSGRVGNDALSAQLGVVWKHNVIDEIIKSSTIGKSSFGLSPMDANLP